MNRIVFKLEAGEDEDCWDVRVRLRCTSSSGNPLVQVGGEAANDASAEGAGSNNDVDPRRMPVFVQKSADTTARVVMENGMALPVGWEPRKDVGTDESHDATTKISLHLGAGKSLIFPLDVYRPLDQTTLPSESDGGNSSCSTTYDVIVMYRQVRSSKKKVSDKSSEEPGDQVMVTQGGSVQWIPPFIAEFSHTNGRRRPFPCGVQHPSNMVSPPAEQSAAGGAELVAANGERLQMRCSLEARGLGSKNVAASIISVTNELSEANKQQKDLFPSESGLFMNQKRQGSKLSLSYSVSARGDIESGSDCKTTMPLGVISIQWKPLSLPLPDDVSTPADTTDEFGPTHGPLALPNLAPVTFYGPQCQVLPSPFAARLLKCPSTPKVGAPFCVSYRVTNRTAKSQTLVLRLNEVQDGDAAGSPHLLGTGKSKEEMQMAPFEEKVFSYSFLSMVSGKIRRPPLTVSSGRHQTWVINETLVPSHLFVMP